MKIIFRKHVYKKQEFFRDLGWEISLDLIQKTISNPTLRGKTKSNQPTAIIYLDENHILRIIYEVRNGIITVITFHISRKGRYET